MTRTANCLARKRRLQEMAMATALRHGQHMHLTTASGEYGVNCTITCRKLGIKEWQT